MLNLGMEQALLIQQLYHNLVAYWDEVDTRGGAQAAEYYLADGVFDGGTHKQVGREAIAKFYNWRANRGARVSRHVVTNFRVEFTATDRATSTWIMLLYAADGEPVLPSLPAIAISEVTDVNVLCDDGMWRYESRTFAALFKGGAATTVPPQEDR
jgi:hypothetical protein